MRRSFEWFDRSFLLNPWISRAGNIATAILLSGLAGGVVANVFNFPVIPLVTTMLGTFLLVLRGAQVVAEKVRPELKEKVLAGECLELAEEIEAFLKERAGSDPASPPLTKFFRKEEEDNPAIRWKEVVDAINHKTETREQYEARFAGRVYKVVNELRAGGHIAEAEAQKLSFPKDSPQGRQRVATRLREFGRRLG